MNARRAKREAREEDDRDASGPRRIEAPTNRRMARKAPTPSELPALRPPRRSIRERIHAAGAALRARFAALYARIRGPAIVLGRVLIVIAAIAGAVALFRVLERHVRTSPAFATREIEVRGAERLDEEEVADIAGLAVGRNVFDIAPEEARRRLLEEPWIAEAEVRRRLPGRWSITIVERRAAAILMLDRAWLVSDDGAVFRPVGDGDPVDLPVITGIDRARFTSSRGFRTRILLAAVALESDWRAAGLWRREPIAEIHVEPDDGLTLRIGEDATEVRLGQGPYRAKLDRLRRVLDELQRREARPAYVHLDNARRPDRVVVRVR